MPVLSEHTGATGLQATTNTPATSSAYLFISLAILLTLGIIGLSRRRSNAYTSSGGKPTTQNAFFISSKRKSSNARMMQEPTPPTSASSALPEKPYLPNAEAVEQHQLATTTTHDHENEHTGGHLAPEDLEPRPFYSPQLQQPQHFPSPTHGREHNMIVQSRGISLPSFHTRLGSLPAVATSLLHPEPPSPTISLVHQAPIMKIQTQNQTPYPTATQTYQNQSQSQAQNQNQLQSQTSYQDQNPYQHQQPYMQNEILFVPSPTEYTSFEALYSNFPTPVYDHGPNPASYASTVFSATPASQQQAVGSAAGEGDVGSVPRRRSYLKTLRDGSEMSGEVIETGQWRRHTKVFGGGVCVACEESEHRRMST